MSDGTGRWSHTPLSSLCGQERWHGYVPPSIAADLRAEEGQTDALFTRRLEPSNRLAQCIEAQNTKTKLFSAHSPLHIIHNIQGNASVKGFYPATPTENS